MADEPLSLDFLLHTSTNTVEADVGHPTWTLTEAVFEEYRSPFWHTGKAKALLDIFDHAEVSPWIGLAVMKRESSFGNVANNPDLDDRNLANPFGVHLNTNPAWPAHAKKNLLLIADPGGSYVNRENPAASVQGYRLCTFEESAQAAASTLRRKGLGHYNERGAAYEVEIDDHLHDILRRLYRDERQREELSRVFAARR